MKLSPHFDLVEFTRSDTALRLGIDNTLPPQLANKALETAHMMEEVSLLTLKIFRPRDSEFECQT